MGMLPVAEEAEYKRLLGVIGQLERSLAVTTSSDVVNALTTYLNSLKTRLSVLEEKKKTIEEEKQRMTDQQNMAVLVERETALNEQEREQYGSFLAQEYFTKADFGSLEQFYGNTWDRLTEGGKSQMSHRVWEGVRREEYRFTELPETIKEKEAERLRDAFRAENLIQEDLTKIPEKDRSDFVSAWDGGRKHESYKVLERPSFAKSVSTSAAVVTASVVTVEAVNGNAVKDAMQSKANCNEKPADTPELMGAVDFKADGLAGISLCKPDMQPPLSGHKRPEISPVKGQ